MPIPLTTVSISVSSIHEIAGAVRGRRQKLGLSQVDVARRAGVSRQWVSAFESGKATAELGLVLRLLDTLGLALSLEPREEHRPPSAPPAFAAVDLDALLDAYREP